MTAAVDLTGWTPIRVSFDGTTPMIDWCYTGKERFADSFFDQTVERCLRRPFSLLFRRAVPIHDVERLVAERPDPAGFVFHASRCGSTLVSQMLAALPGAHVLSEPPPVDTILRSRFTQPGVSADGLASWVRTIVLALSRPGSRSFYKFDSWTAIDLPILRRAFPDVPWVFLYREPAEILGSQLRRRGAHMIPGVLPPELFGLGADGGVAVPPEVYCARVLSAILAAGLTELERNPGVSLAANYRRLPASMFDEIAPLFSLEVRDEDHRRMLDVARWDAKNPALEYDPGLAAVAMPEVAAAADHWAGPFYARLEALR